MGKERYGQYYAEFLRNKKKIMATEDLCAICGKPVDKTLQYPHPLSATVDHIIPIVLGGHPADIDNLQLAHFSCNRQKADKVQGITPTSGNEKEIVSNRILPLSRDWAHYHA